MGKQAAKATIIKKKTTTKPNLFDENGKFVGDNTVYTVNDLSEIVRILARRLLDKEDNESVTDVASECTGCKKQILWRRGYTFKRIPKTGKMGWRAMCLDSGDKVTRKDEATGVESEINDYHYCEQFQQE